MGYQRSKRYPELFKKEGSSRWWAFLPNPAGGRKLRESTGLDDEKAAHLWYLERIRAKPDADKRDEISLHDALDRRRAERARVGRATGTIHCYTVKGKALESLLGKDTPISALDARTIDNYIAARLIKVSRSTVHKELITLRGTLKLARRQGYRVRPVEEIMPTDFGPQYRPKDRALSLKEIDLLLSKLSPKRAAIVAFILATGATYPSELEKLRKGDINTTTWMVHLRGTKRETRDRRVPIVPFARAWLTQALPYMPFEKWTNVRRDLHVACDAAGIAHCSPNDLRRSVATLLRARGVEPQLIGAYLGHADSRMAERVYGRLAPEQLAHLLAARLRAVPKRQRKDD
jgi:integrase